MFNYDIAIYFQAIDDDKLPFSVYLPIRPIIGKMSEDTSLFFEYLTGQTFINTDIAFARDLPDGFNSVVKTSDLRKKNPFKSVIEAYRSAWLEVEKYVYFYEEENMTFIAMDAEEFQETFQVKLNIVHVSEINSLNQALLVGSEEDIVKYRDQVYSIDNIEKPQSESFECKLEKPISELIDVVCKKVISQDAAVKKMVTAIYKNLLFNSPNMKSNILMYGPTGVGKTALVRALKDAFDVPVWIEDMTRFTETGYKGADVDDILVNLYHNAGDNLEKAQRSILFLDEIDKKASSDIDDRAFNKSAVLKGLLKIVEGGVFQLEIGSSMNPCTISFDTSNLTDMNGMFSY